MAGEFDPRFSYGLLNLAHRAQDCRYGFGDALKGIPVLEQPMNESEFDPRAALGRISGTVPHEPPAAGGVTDPPPPAPTHAETREQRRSAALEMVAKYREAHPGDPRTDDQLLVAPYGGYELLLVEGVEAYRRIYMERLAAQRPKPPEEARP
jgi:hypothetical protein